MNKNVNKAALTWEDIAMIHSYLEDVFTEPAAGEICIKKSSSDTKKK